MFIQQHPGQMRERSTSRSGGSSAQDSVGPKPTRERSSSTSEARDLYTKRSSIFSKRPKSILTTASNDSSTRSIASTNSGSDLSRSSPGGDASTHGIDLEGGKGRFLFGRGRKNRMSALRALPNTNDLHRTGSSGKGVRISAPFDFQHVGKIEEAQTQTLGVDSAEAYENFRTLSRGHRNAVIAPILDEEEADANGSPVRQRRAPPLRPQRPDDLWSYEPKSAPLPQVQERYLSAAYIDNSRQPSWTHSRGDSLSRRLPIRSAPSTPQSLVNGPGPTIDSDAGLRNVDSFDDYDAFVPLYDSQPPGWIENSLPLLHTVSPVDTFTEHVRTPAFNPPLAQVPEEPEGTFSNRPSRDLPRRPSLRHSKSTPIIASRFRSSIDPFLVDDLPLPSSATRSERPLSQCSQGSDTLGNPLMSSWHETKPKTKARSLDFEEQKHAAEPAWEDYIEYCYEHNAEADCEFDWQETSHFDDQDSDASESWNQRYSPYTSTLRPKREDARSLRSTVSHAQSFASDKLDRVPSHNSIPELDYRYSRATSTASVSIATPRDGSLYRTSDIPPLPTDMHVMKDAWGTQFVHGDNTDNEVHAGRTAIVPDSPQHADERLHTLPFAAVASIERQNAALPTPPLSSKKSASLLERSLNSKASSSFSIGADDAFNEQAIHAESPTSDGPTHEHGASIPRSSPEVLLSGKAWPLSGDGLVPAMDFDSKPPTPPKSPTASELESSRSFLTTPSPKLVAQPKPSPIIEEMAHPKSPIHISFPSIDLPPLAMPKSPSPLVVLPHTRTSSVAERIGPLPSSSSKSVDVPGTPESATSAPEGRSGYSLFPYKKPSMASLNGQTLSMPPTSFPISMSEPSLTRPVSRAASQASSSRSSSRALSFKSKSSKKANAYQERFPLGI